MIRRLKRRFVTIAMLSLLGILLVVLATVNILFWRNSMEASDSLLTYLAENDGGFDPTDAAADSAEPSPDMDINDSPDEWKRFIRQTPTGFLMTQETAFRTRCFSVHFDAAGSVTSVRTDRIAAVSEAEALAYANRAMQRDNDRGMMGIYRFYAQHTEAETVIVFLDCNDVLVNFAMLFALSSGIMLFCLAAMWVLLWIFSGKAIRPVVESMEKQRRFIADAGHELKTPLTIINADAAVLSMTGSNNEWVDSIRNQTRRLERLVHEMLDLSRMEQDAPLAMAEFSLSEAAEDAVGAFSPLAAGHGVAFSADIQTGLSIRGNEEALRRLFSILLDNAVKYTPEGGEIALLIKKSGHSVIIETRNTCLPIEKSHLDRLFERFYRVDPARTSGGYGIGLAIAHEILLRHGGKISAACPAPDAITFTATLPG